jgi:uncharacterized OsmC-like protein
MAKFRGVMVGRETRSRNFRFFANKSRRYDASVVGSLLDAISHLAALGACVTITLQMYAARKQWPLHAVSVEASHEKALADGNRDGEARIEMVDRISVRVSLGGDLSEDQLDRLVQIAERCPIHRMLVPQVKIQTTRNDTCLSSLKTTQPAN